MKIINIKGTRKEKCTFNVDMVDIASEDEFRNQVAQQGEVTSELNFNIHHEEPEYEYRVDEYEVVDEERGAYNWPAPRAGEAVTISVWYQISPTEFHDLSRCMEDTFQAADEGGIIRYYKYEVTSFEPEAGELLSKLLDDYVDEGRANNACRLEILESPFLEGTYWKHVRKPVTSD